MVEESLLPNRGGNRKFSAERLCRPFLPSADEARQSMWRSSRFFRAEEMNVVRHDHIAAYEPPVSQPGGFPFGPQNVRDVQRGQNGAAVVRANGDEIHRIGNPNPFQALQMAMHGHGLGCSAQRSEGQIQTWRPNGFVVARRGEPGGSEARNSGQVSALAYNETCGMGLL